MSWPAVAEPRAPLLLPAPVPVLPDLSRCSDDEDDESSEEEELVVEADDELLMVPVLPVTPRLFVLLNRG